jgi:hypothetical protein
MNRAVGGVIGLTLASLMVRSAWLMRTVEPTGWDGYYYVAQARHLAEDGHFHVADPSWALYLCALPHLLGVAPAVGIKLVAATLAAACVPAAWLLGRRAEPRTGWWLALWAAGSPALTHLAGDFPKNLGAAAPLLLGFALTERPALSLLMAGIAGWAHRLGAVLALAAAPAVTRRWWLASACVGVSAAIALWRSNRPGLDDAFGLAWPPSPWAYFSLRTTAWPEAVELSLAWPALIAAVVALRRRPDRRPLIFALALPLLVCALPLWRTDTLDLGYRLALMGPVFSVPLLVLCAPRLPPAWVALPLATLAVTGFDPLAAPDYGRYRALIANIPRPLPALLIAHQGINFLYDAETGHEAMAWAPDPQLDRTQVYRLAWGFTDGEWLAYAPGEPALRLDAQYVYVREDVWERFAAAARLARDDELDERLADHRNPSKLRKR